MKNHVPRTILSLLAVLAGFVTLTAMPAEAAASYCREYTQRVIINGRDQITYGTACLQPDGSWQMIGVPAVQPPTIVYTPNSSTRIVMTHGTPVYSYAPYYYAPPPKLYRRPVHSRPHHHHRPPHRHHDRRDRQGRR